MKVRTTPLSYGKPERRAKTKMGTPLKCPECGQEFQFAGNSQHYNRARHVESSHFSNGGHWSFNRETAPWYYTASRDWAPGTDRVGKSPREDVNESARFNAKHRAFFMDEGERLVREGRRSYSQSEARGGSSTGSSSHPTDDRTQEQKLEAMARQTVSPKEAEVAKHLLFKKYGRKL
jgi:uncharacterized C2H2 Zn-finger protein